MEAKFERTVVFRTLGFAGISSPVISQGLLIRRVLITEFEFARCRYFVGCVVFVNESEAELNTVLTENIPHRPAIDIGKARSITECDPLAFVKGNRSCNALTFVVLEVVTHELSQRIALATKHTSLDSPLDEEIEIVWIGTGNSSHRSLLDYVFILFMNCARMPYALRRPVSTSAAQSANGGPQNDGEMGRERYSEG